jgi:hypothetical protein
MGVSFKHLEATREIYIFDDPALIADDTSVNARYAGLHPSDGWVKNIQFGAKGDIIAKTLGGSSTTQFCDYTYNPAFASGWRALLSGGSAFLGAYAGPLAANANLGASGAYAYIGARLFAR